MYKMRKIIIFTILILCSLLASCTHLQGKEDGAIPIGLVAEDANTKPTVSGTSDLSVVTITLENEDDISFKIYIDNEANTYSVANKIHIENYENCINTLTPITDLTQEEIAILYDTGKMDTVYDAIIQYCVDSNIPFSKIPKDESELLAVVVDEFAPDENRIIFSATEVIPFDYSLDFYPGVDKNKPVYIFLNAVPWHDL